MDNKYVKIHSLLRMFAALIAIAAFISMFVAKQAQHQDTRFFGDVIADFNNGAFFGGSDKLWAHGNFISFIGYLLILVGGLAGLAFVFVDEMIGKDLTKKLSFVVAGAILLGAISLFLFGPLFNAFNDRKDMVTSAAPIVFGVLAVIAACGNAAAPILEEKGY